MCSSVSPYELLRTSKPRPAATMITPYDLYSAVQRPYGRSSYAQENIKEGSSLSQEQSSSSEMPRIPCTKTHYIQDIHKRHNLAAHQSQSQDAIANKQFIHLS